MYYGDVAAKVMGWDITLRKGSNKHGKPLLHIGKSAKLWDKNTKVIITVSIRCPIPSSGRVRLDCRYASRVIKHPECHPL